MRFIVYKSLFLLPNEISTESVLSVKQYYHINESKSRKPLKICKISAFEPHYHNMAIRFILKSTKYSIFFKSSKFLTKTSSISSQIKLRSTAWKPVLLRVLPQPKKQVSNGPLMSIFLSEKSFKEGLRRISGQNSKNIDISVSKMSPTGQKTQADSEQDSEEKVCF